MLAALVVLACSGDDGVGQPDADAHVDATDTAARTDAFDATEDASSPTPGACRFANTDGATAACLEPNRPPDYYIEQALAYFDTLDTTADRDSVPNYAELVVRWEWPPWLLLTGYGAEEMIRTSNSLRDLDPSTVPERDCRFFDEQPFARCYVVFEYEEGPCPIYEEFVFDAEGEMTFIEAWSDLPGMLPNAPDDRWAERDDFPRLSTRVPGLGSPAGTIALDTEWMARVAAEDEDVAELAERATDWWAYWFEELTSTDPDFFAIGCGWE